MSFPRRIIFLDVDGVLNSDRSHSMKALSRGNLRVLERLVRDTRAEIVVTSTWRKFPEYLARLSHTLSYRGMWITGRTMELGDDRALEIRMWLAANQSINPGMRYVIIDDLPPDTFDEDQQRHLVTTSMATGLTEADADRAREILR